MKLEEKVKQAKFNNEQQKAVLNIIFTGTWLNNMNQAMLKPFGISPEQYNVLRILRGQYPKPITLGLIQERMLDKMSNATRLVEKLKQKGLLDRKECAYNRRQVDIIITEKGLDLLAATQPSMDDMSQFKNAISPEEAKLLNRLLDKARE